MVPRCAKCNKSLSYVKRWSQCSQCKAWLCPSCTLRFCIFCKGLMDDVRRDSSEQNEPGVPGGVMEAFMAKIGCLSMIGGILTALLAAAAKLAHFCPMNLGPRSFAAASALLLLLSIATHTCASVCCGAKGS